MRKIILVIVTMLMFVSAQAQHLDLTGGEVVNQGICKHSDRKVYQCVAVLHETKMYNVLFDKDGEVAIYLIVNNGATLIWARNSI
jgi:collagenase-like PrtC family protease